MKNAVSGFDWRFAVTLVVPALVIIIGWGIVSWLTSQRDVENRRREARITALSSLYMKLARITNRTTLTDVQKDDFESFVSEIQLYGSPRQVTLMSGLVEEMKVPNKSVSFDNILASLRDELREELKLETIEGPVWWYRSNR